MTLAQLWRKPEFKILIAGCLIMCLSFINLLFIEEVDFLKSYSFRQLFLDNNIHLFNVHNYTIKIKNTQRYIRTNLCPIFDTPNSSIIYRRKNFWITQLA